VRGDFPFGDFLLGRSLLCWFCLGLFVRVRFFLLTADCLVLFIRVPAVSHSAFVRFFLLTADFASC